MMGLAALFACACEKDKPAGDTTATANAEPAATGAAATAAAAAAGDDPAPKNAASPAVGTPAQGVTAGDAGIRILNGEKKVELGDGGLHLTNERGQGSVTVTDAGTVIQGKSGKTLTIPSVPGLPTGR